jgi:hypothetical protein
MLGPVHDDVTDGALAIVWLAARLEVNRQRQAFEFTTYIVICGGRRDRLWQKLSFR